MSALATRDLPVPRALPAGLVRHRDRYVDSLRVLALGRVMLYHTFGWAWLPLVFPSMGVMFALAGSLVAASLTRAPHGHYGVIARRLRRLLPPVWALGLVLVPAMAVGGWAAEAPGEPLRWTHLLLWLLPLGTPPADAQGHEWVVPLWYIRSYLWFLLLSPALLWLFRRWPRRVLAVFPVTVALIAAGVVQLSGRSGDAVLDGAVFGACWLLGYAHHDGALRRLPLRLVLPLAAALMAAGGAWAVLPAGGEGWDIDDIPLANALYSLGYVLVLLRLYPSFAWMERVPVLDSLVSAVNSRAMTIYLWGNVSIWAATPLLDRSPLAPYYTDSWVGDALQLSAACTVLLVCVLALGWVEDLAARRPARLLPRSGRGPSAPTGPAPSRPAQPAPPAAPTSPLT